MRVGEVGPATPAGMHEIAAQASTPARLNLDNQIKDQRAINKTVTGALLRKAGGGHSRKDYTPRTDKSHQLGSSRRQPLSSGLRHNAAAH